MKISGWIQLALFVGVLLAITKPLGIYLCQVLDADGRTFLDPVLKPIESLVYKLTGVDPEEAGLEALHARDVALQCGRVAFYLCHPPLTGGLPFQNLFNPQNLPASQRASFVQHRGEFHHEYQLAELRRRIDHELFLADGRADIP